jgi:hypothetical protein
VPTWMVSAASEGNCHRTELNRKGSGQREQSYSHNQRDNGSAKPAGGLNVLGGADLKSVHGQIYAATDLFGRMSLFRVHAHEVTAARGSAPRAMGR